MYELEVKISLIKKGSRYEAISSRRIELSTDNIEEMGDILVSSSLDNLAVMRWAKQKHKWNLHELSWLRSSRAYRD